MNKYNLKKMVSVRGLYNDDYFTNGHILLKKSILTKTQLKTIDKTERNDKRVDGLVNDILHQVEQGREFTPSLVKDSSIATVIYDSGSETGIDQQYFNLINAKKLKLYNGKNGISPLTIYQGEERVGILLPIRMTSVSDEGIDYYEYVESQRIAKENRQTA